MRLNCFRSSFSVKQERKGSSSGGTGSLLGRYTGSRVKGPSSTEVKRGLGPRSHPFPRTDGRGLRPPTPGAPRYRVGKDGPLLILWSRGSSSREWSG